MQGPQLASGTEEEEWGEIKTRGRYDSKDGPRTLRLRKKRREFS